MPAAGQGAIGIECRSDDSTVRELIAPLNDKCSAICVRCERQVAKLLGADCSLPIALFARMSDKEIHISSFVGDEHSSLRLRKSVTGLVHNGIQLAEELAQSLIDDGAASIS